MLEHAQDHDMTVMVVMIMLARLLPRIKAVTSNCKQRVTCLNAEMYVLA